MGKVMVILGSASDRGKMEPAIWELVGKVEVEVHVISAHRTPEKLRNIIMSSDADVCIAGASMAAALPGAIASLTSRPVIGVPLSGNVTNGIDALFTIAQMPKGVPVATVAIDGAENAAILALEILSLKNVNIGDEIYKMREEMRVEAEVIDRDFIDHVNARKRNFREKNRNR